MHSLRASAPVLKLHKDDVVTAATVTSEVPIDPATTIPAALALVHVTNVPPQDHLACGLSDCLTSSWSAVRFPVSRNLVYELTMG